MIDSSELKKVLYSNPSLVTSISFMKNIMHDLISYDTDIDSRKKIIILFKDKSFLNAITDIKNRNKSKIIDLIIKKTKCDNIFAETITNCFFEAIDENLIELLNTGKVENINQYEHMPIIEEVKIDKDKVVIPCSCSKNGQSYFIVHNVSNAFINKTYSLSYEENSLIAVVYNYLTRSHFVDKPKHLLDLKNKCPDDWSVIYQLMITILLIAKSECKNGCINCDFSIDCLNEGKLAFETINNYLELFQRMMGKKKDEMFFLKQITDKKSIIGFTNEAKYFIEIIENKIDYPIQQMYADFLYYRLDESNKKYVEEYFLLELSYFEYTKFKPGQYEALSNILNNLKANHIVIMPTGSGKSLIFYLLAIFEPKLFVVISPTTLLINNQLENLLNTHNIMFAENGYVFNKDNANIENIYNRARMIYLTPEEIQSGKIKSELIIMNDKKILGSIILDEIHCVSTLSHNFRPNYLILASQLKKYFSETSINGFTATATFSVINDLISSLNIHEKNVIVPQDIVRKTMDYSISWANNFDEMLYQLVLILNQIANYGKTIIFTKSNKISKFIHKKLFENNIYSVVWDDNSNECYRQFKNCQINILIATFDFGVGIDLPDVLNTIHFGAPVSKSEYVQQIGRAARQCGEHATSYVILQNPNLKESEKLLQRSYDFVNSDYFNNNPNFENNDYVDLLFKFSCSIYKGNDFISQFKKCYDELVISKNNFQFKVKQYDFERQKQVSLFLYIFGLITNWDDITRGHYTTIYWLPTYNLELYEIKRNICDYILRITKNKKIVSDIYSTSSFYETLKTFTEWYAKTFIDYHREQLIDIVSMFKDTINTKICEVNRKNCENINIELASYFVLPFVSLKDLEAKCLSKSPDELLKLNKSFVGIDMLDLIYQISSTNPNINYDIIIFLYDIFHRQSIDKDRTGRIIQYCCANDLINDLLKFFDRFLLDKDELTKQYYQLEIAKIFLKYTNCNLSLLLNYLYKNKKIDEFYLGLLGLYIDYSFSKLQNDS